MIMEEIISVLKEATLLCNSSLNFQLTKNPAALSTSFVTFVRKILMATWSLIFHALCIDCNHESRISRSPGIPYILIKSLYFLFQKLDFRSSLLSRLLQCLYITARLVQKNSFADLKEKNFHRHSLWRYTLSTVSWTNSHSWHRYTQRDVFFCHAWNTQITVCENVR